MTLRTALRLGRVSNLPTVWTNVLAAGLIAGGADALGVVVWLMPCLSLFYVGGMYLNDAFDREIDARERPERPIPSGEVSARIVFAAGFGLLAAGLAGLVGVGATRGHATEAALGGVALAGLIVLYDAWHKANALAPGIMGLCRAGVYVAVATALVGWPTPLVESPLMPVLLGAIVLWAYVVGLTAIAAQETLARLRSWWPLALLLIPALIAVAALAMASEHVGLSVGVLLVAYLFWLAFSLSQLRAGRIGAGVVRLIAGICWVDALRIATYVPADSAIAALVAGFAGVALTRALQSRIPGT